MSASFCGDDASHPPQTPEEFPHRSGVAQGSKTTQKASAPDGSIHLGRKCLNCGRNREIRTLGLLLPKQTRYQAALYSERAQSVQGRLERSSWGDGNYLKKSKPPVTRKSAECPMTCPNGSCQMSKSGTALAPCKARRHHASRLCAFSWPH